MFRQPEMRDGEDAVQPGDAGESAPAMPPVDINTRAAKRQTVELVLDGAMQFRIVHILAHGVASLTASVLDFGGERMSEAELVSRMSSQKTLQFVILACCNGYEAAGGIHNALHVPVVAYNAPIEDRAAVEFARGFYRSWRRDRDVGQAVDRGREALAVLYPSEASKVCLINGDMVTPSAFGACIGKIDERLDVMGVQLVGINQRLDRIEAFPQRWADHRGAAWNLIDRGAGGDAISERGTDPDRTVVAWWQSLCLRRKRSARRKASCRASKRRGGLFAP